MSSGLAERGYECVKGLKLGIYGDAGTRTCAGYPGSLGHEDLDARTWADWGVDYLKYDNCNNQSDGSQADYIRRYTAMRDALLATGMWAMMAAPLLIGTDLRTASPETMAILGNREIIAIDQDRLGVQGRVVVDRDGLMVLDKPLANGERAVALYNSTDSLATVSVPAGQTGLPRADAYRLRNVWTGEVLQAKTTIEAAVPAHGTVVYRLRPSRDPAVPPLVTVGATLGTLVPGEGGTLTTTVTNRGAGALRNVSVSATVPPRWTVTPISPPVTGRLPTDASLETTWTVTPAAGAAAGQYPVTLTATHRRGTSTSQLVSTVVNAPPDGRRYLSTITPVVSEGQVATDLSTGGSLITIAGRVYQRGIGTTTRRPSTTTSAADAPT